MITLASQIDHEEINVDRVQCDSYLHACILQGAQQVRSYSQIDHEDINVDRVQCDRYLHAYIL